jgi:hypothetical protein
MVEEVFNPSPWRHQFVIKSGKHRNRRAVIRLVDRGTNHVGGSIDNRARRRGSWARGYTALAGYVGVSGLYRRIRNMKELLQGVTAMHAKDGDMGAYPS